MVGGTNLVHEPTGIAKRFLVRIETTTVNQKTIECLGAAISPRVFITAAHCVDDARLVYVHAITRLEINHSELSGVPADYAIKHPEYQLYTGTSDENWTAYESARHNDIAVVTISRHLDVVPVPLVPEDFTLHSFSRMQDDLISFGYERNQYRSDLAGFEYAKVQSLAPHDQGSRFLFGRLAQAQMCSGDSGGPVAIFAMGRFWLAGVQVASRPEDMTAEDYAAALRVHGSPSNIPTCGTSIGTVDLTRHLSWIKGVIDDIDDTMSDELQSYSGPADDFLAP